MTPKQEHLLVAMGVALLQIQMTERVLRLCMRWVLPKQSPVTLELFERQELLERRKTLGYFVAELKKRVGLDDGFEALIDEFLERRNAFVHGLFDVSGFSTETDEGLAVAESYVAQVLNVTEKVMYSFLGLMSSWQEQIGLQIPESEASNAFFAEINTQYKTMVDQLFLKKET